MDEFDSMNRSFFLDNSELSKVQEYTDFIHCFISENDPHLPTEKLKEFAKIINGKLHVIPDAGHFNLAAGYDKFPGVYQIIQDFEGIKD